MRIEALAVLVISALAVACSDPLVPRIGDVRLTVATTGADLDPDGYSVALDGGAGLAIASNDARILPGLPAGSHTFLLSGLAANCTVGGTNPRDIEVASHETTEVRFAIACAALPPLNIAGVWDWTEQYVNSVCHDTGTYVFSQTGATFSGRSDQVGVCETTYGPWDNTSSNDPVSSGVVSGKTITFLVGANGQCTYIATVTGTPPDHLSGTTICGDATGTWEAVRGQPVATVTVTPPHDTLLEGGTVQLAAQLWSAAGHRVFRQPVTWSSDHPSVATVSDSGRVTAVSAGAATITAGAAGMSGTAAIVVPLTGAVRVTTSTTGVDLDLDGYIADVDGSWDGSRSVGVNGTVILTGIRPGNHTVGLVTASNCTVAGTHPAPITVAGGDTIPVTFDVACVRTQRIAFATAYFAGIYAMSANGADAARLISSTTYTRYGHPSWSPDGTKIAFHSDRDGNDELYVMSADGSGVTRLTNNAAVDGVPAWSPDGTKIAFVSSRDGRNEIYVMNPDGSGVTRLSSEEEEEQQPSWSPDGTRIAFISARDGHYDIYEMNVDGSGITRLTNDPSGTFEPSWSPDGTRIAFRSNRDGNAQIYVMNADGSGATRLTNNYDSDWQPTWSPDGSRIAFTKNVYGCDDYDCWDFTSIYVINADGSGLTQLIGTNTGLDSDPAWRP